MAKISIPYEETTRPKIIKAFSQIGRPASYDDICKIVDRHIDFVFYSMVCEEILRINPNKQEKPLYILNEENEHVKKYR